MTKPESTLAVDQPEMIQERAPREGARPAGLVRKVGRQLKRLQRRAINAAINNLVINNMAIRLRLERRLKDIQHPYRKFVPKSTLTHQENAGFSDRPEINQALARTHADLAQAARLALGDGGQPRPARVLDIGCGPGLYLRDFAPDQFALTGIDINAGMCRLARESVPHATILEGDFIQVQPEGTFDLIYSIGVFMYICRMDVDAFFAKVHRLLRVGGVFFLNYQHALSWKDLAYPDLTYIQYSPVFVERMAKRYLEIVEHRHAFDNRTIGWYDRTPHESLNPNVTKTFLNASVLIARRSK
jgi:SAM-dependent methyltransferase